ALRLGGLSALTDVWGQEIAGNLRLPSLKASTNAITMFPNPSAGELHLTWANAQTTPSEVIVRDLAGRVVTMVSPVQGTQTLRMDLNAVPAGSYSVELLWNAGEGIARVERSTLVVRP
ncbi:MAG: T9SS type A sorting domain-containing protein, partial [Sphingomonadales bacterium]|nr:T9SS type A sorting domain-containing protein [Sphingomonadales bacterium]